MEQKPSSPGRSPELPSVSPPSNGEVLQPSHGPEVQNGGSVERREQRSESAPAAERIAAPQVQLPAPVVGTSSSDDVTNQLQTSKDDDLPSVAHDDELIEKEWVNKAKQVIAETRDDPYKREQEVARLQADYLAKRYGRELGTLQ